MNTVSHKGKLLGIDYGDTRIGVAITDEDQLMVFGRDIIDNKGGEYVVTEIRKLCEQEKIVGIVIGLPLLLSGEKTDQTRKIEQFGDMLQTAVGVKIYYEDESLTSFKSDGMITPLMRESKKSKKKRNAYKDQRNITSATLILQSFLDRE